MNYKKFGKLVIAFWLLFGYWLLVIGYCPLYALNIDRIKADFLKGDYNSCIEDGERKLVEAYNSREIDELYYILGLSYLKSGNYMRASDIFEIITNEFKDSRFRDDAYIGLGDVYFMQEDYSKAEAKYKQLLKISPSTKLVALMHFKLAQVMLKQGKWEEARQHLDKLSRDFPLTPESRMAKDLSGQEFYFTVQAGSFSNEKNANTLYGKLRDKKFDVYIQEFDSDGKKVYRVRVGKLSTRPEAEQLEKELTALGFPARIFP